MPTKLAVMTSIIKTFTDKELIDELDSRLSNGCRPFMWKDAEIVLSEKSVAFKIVVQSSEVDTGYNPWI